MRVAPSPAAGDNEPVAIRDATPGRPRPARRAFARAEPFWRDALLRRTLALTDVAAVVLVGLALAVGSESTVDTAFWSTVFVPVWVILAKLYGLYDRDHRALRHLTVDELPVIFMWALTGTALVAVLLTITPVGSLDGASVVRAWLVAATSAFVLRAVARFLWRRLIPPEPTLIVGNGSLADATRRKLELFPDIHVRVVAEVDDHRRAFEHPNFSEVDRVILAADTIDEETIRELVEACRARHVKLNVIPPSTGMFGAAVRVNHVADLSVVDYNTVAVPRSMLAVKRAMDVALSLVALVVLAPILVLIAVAIRLDSPGRSLFSQARAGLGGRPFRVFKFRTMVIDAEKRLPDLVAIDNLAQPLFKLRRDPRVTRVGRLLRRTSLDELPQLLNVLRGDMSLVGPRPELVDLVERWPPEHRFRLSVKPGITGPMQVFGRSELSFDEWMAVEREYIENLSLGRDVRMLVMTVSAVVTGKGAF